MSFDDRLFAAALDWDGFLSRRVRRAVASGLFVLMVLFPATFAGLVTRYAERHSNRIVERLAPTLPDSSSPAAPRPSTSR